jgi:ribonuclease VapC
MTVFVDASVLVAIMSREEGWQALSDCLEAAKNGLTSSIAIFEAGLAIARKKSVESDRAGRDVQSFLDYSGVTIVALIPEDGEAALAVHHRFGKGRHRAALNMGDCFAYACAKRLCVPLLYKGNDFALTDISSALETNR